MPFTSVHTESNNRSVYTEVSRSVQGKPLPVNGKWIIRERIFLRKRVNRNFTIHHSPFTIHWRRRRPGFSLVEILLTLFFAAVLITILLTSTTTLTTGRRSNLQAIATKIATRDIETLRQTDFNSLPSDTGSTCLQDYAAELAKLPNSCHTRQVVNFQSDPDIKQFTITLTWHDSGQNQCELSICKVQMNALIYKNGL